MLLRKKANNLRFKGKVESGLKGGGLARRTTASVRYSNLEKYHRECSNMFSCTNFYLKTVQITAE